jgi:hypothetical protein
LADQDEIEVIALAENFKARFAQVRADEEYSWATQPINVLDGVLSLNRRYDSFVFPRVQRFAKRHPTVVTLRGLGNLIRAYRTPLEFSRTELDYNDTARAATLMHVTGYLGTAQRSFRGSTEQERLTTWARSVRPSECYAVSIRGFGLAGFQYMRMLFGMQTVQPDVHICRYVSQVVGRRVNDWTALELLEAAAVRAGVPIREVDGAIWAAAARSGVRCSK